MASILVIEDDQHIRASVARLLASEGHDVETSGTAMAGLEKAVHGGPDLVLLDLGLPDVDGTELLKMIRAVSAVPVIVITARGDDQVVVATLDGGADDYLVKPFTTSQLAARVRAMLRRTGSAGAGEQIDVGGLRIDVPARTAELEGAALDLSPKEFDLLVALARRRGEVMSKRDLLAEVWREPYGGSERTVDVHLSWLRKKLGESAAEPRYLHTVFGVGVKLVDPSS
ncbi:MAG: response regulator transcription factor [Actinobacteria bacterium]|nr:response regulator transcription factor [Actinomycetota bacterium]